MDNQNIAFEIGALIRKHRKAAKLSQEALARKIDMSTISIRQYEAGVRPPKRETLEKIATALEVDFLELLPPRAFPPALSHFDESTKTKIIKAAQTNSFVNQLLFFCLQIPNEEDQMSLLKIIKGLAEEKEDGHIQEEND